jgi:ligand-binding SRPBCC domain-containing protein
MCPQRWKLEQRQVIPRPRAEVFEFFADAYNLERITPALLSFRILTPRPIEMRQGALIDYKLKLYGFPVKWKTRIEVWEPEERFVDMQLSGPYRYWHHLHEFEEVDEGTLMKDTVHYELPFGPLGTLARSILVKRSLDTIFSHRKQAISEIFGRGDESLQLNGH